jgi:hypothetical protein
MLGSTREVLPRTVILLTHCFGVSKKFTLSVPVSRCLHQYESIVFAPDAIMIGDLKFHKSPITIFNKNKTSNKKCSRTLEF